MGLANLAPVVVTALLPANPVSPLDSLPRVVLTRVPLLFMGPIQAMILPAMTAAAATGDRHTLRSPLPAVSV